jgi:transcription initiation factor TFIIIB Brf1 subunit/transcription initiation factor TFIIB
MPDDENTRLAAQILAQLREMARRSGSQPDPLAAIAALLANLSRLATHMAALEGVMRAEIDQLRERLDRIDTGER